MSIRFTHVSVMCAILFYFLFFKMEYSLAKMELEYYLLLEQSTILKWGNNLKNELK